MKVLAVVCGSLLAGCEGSPSVLQPRGPAAASIADLWWFMLAAGTVVWLAVMAFLGLGLWRRRRAAGQPEEALPSDEAHGLPGQTSAWIIGGGVVLPFIILTATYVLTLGTLRAIGGAPTDELVVDVIGRQWWWEVRYPQLDFVTANEIHIPAGRPVTLQLTSGDVIHSFWVPELHGKMDLNPGSTNRLVLQADAPGIYRGQCAEFCGVQHAKMALLVIADEPGDFQAWVANQQQPAPPPTTELAMAGQQVFLNSACVYCHAVRGTAADGVQGPDLTHLASRLTLAANTVPNTRGHLAGWIVDPHGIKPGNLMPPTDLGSDELQALLAYLESLQ